MAILRVRPEPEKTEQHKRLIKTTDLLLQAINQTYPSINTKGLLHAAETNDFERVLGILKGTRV